MPPRARGAGMQPRLLLLGAWEQRRSLNGY
eukprot:COSAG05_NODE_14737_length_388_cov_1.121107_1_plen_29_part_01